MRNRPFPFLLTEALRQVFAVRVTPSVGRCDQKCAMQEAGRRPQDLDPVRELNCRGGILEGLLT
jgi:hypothetical protein